MKKFFKKTISLILAVSALCILFAFQASALTTNCPYCGAECSYNRLPMDLRHECECPTHGTFYEEDCEGWYVPSSHDCTDDWVCPCGHSVPDSGNPEHRWTWTDYDNAGHDVVCNEDGCTQTDRQDHNLVYNGGNFYYCTLCPFYLQIP